MFGSMDQILVMDQPCEATAAWLSARLAAEGFHIQRTFEMQLSKATQPGCPIFAIAGCECVPNGCTLIVLLVYASGAQPISLILQGQGSQTRLFLPQSPGQSGVGKLQTSIQAALT